MQAPHCHCTGGSMVHELREVLPSPPHSQLRLPKLPFAPSSCPRPSRAPLKVRHNEPGPVAGPYGAAVRTRSSETNDTLVVVVVLSQSDPSGLCCCCASPRLLTCFPMPGVVLSTFSSTCEALLLVSQKRFTSSRTNIIRTIVA